MCLSDGTSQEPRVQNLLHCSQQIEHSDQRKSAEVFLNDIIYTVSILCVDNWLSVVSNLLTLLVLPSVL